MANQILMGSSSRAMKISSLVESSNLLEKIICCCEANDVTVSTNTGASGAFLLGPDRTNNVADATQFEKEHEVYGYEIGKVGTYRHRKTLSGYVAKKS